MAEAMATGRTIACANAQIDPRFLERESVEKHEIEAVLCVPLGVGTTYGVLYIQGRRAHPGSSWSFDADTRTSVELVARILSFAIERPFASGGRTSTPPGVFAPLQGKSPALEAAVNKLRMAAPLDIHILLSGASGTGKTLLARLTHQASRAGEPFVELNCATLPEALLENELFGAELGAHSAAANRAVKGKVEAAEGGTLFLDEIAELSVAAQAKVLQLLQSKTYYRLGSNVVRQANIRIIAASNVDLRQAVDEKKFRGDLYFRLKVLEVRVPSLAERRSDIPMLALSFLRSATQKHDLGDKVLAPSTLRALELAEWPGNVRELAHQIESAAICAHLRQSACVEPEDLTQDRPAPSGAPGDLSEPESLRRRTREFQRRHLEKVLSATNWDMPEAARILDVSRTHLYALVRTHDLGAPGRRSQSRAR